MPTRQFLPPDPWSVDDALVILGLRPSRSRWRRCRSSPPGAASPGRPNGGIPVTQEMLDFCAEHSILLETELISADYVNQAYERVLSSDVRYRFVIDAKTFA
jgi:alcohol dehydrogenase (NADP+)